jgi:hypothetical protein
MGFFKIRQPEGTVCKESRTLRAAQGSALYQFKDHVFVLKQLRDVCKVKCATVYPAVFGECIKEVIDHVRLSHPDDFAKVNVHTKEFALKVSRRPKGKKSNS